MEDCFNSTLVQLKGFFQTGSFFVCQCFNSTLVQLKGFVPVLAAFTFCCFNSTLVQLKEAPIFPKDFVF